ncbi:cupin domain-containing protein [Larkinella soli]|uniref:cupin domain-containing protein n=1 Tax=Larkinella soli TaxID=1770527 RepID=UPI000FFB95C8|nr:cupin domain-containing protein [Larkinella soli]
MKAFSILGILLLIGLRLNAQTVDSVASGVYVWNETPVVRKGTSDQRQLLKGPTRDFRRLEIHATTLPARQAPHPAHRHADEELILMKEGELTVTIAGRTQTLGPGSVALIMPGDEHGFENRGSGPATYYVMRYESRAPADSERGRKAGGSFWIDWNEVPFQGHDKGGIRRMFDRATAMTQRFEMHVTTLNPGLWSHPPHTHRAAEILLMIEQSAEESIDGKLHAATAGDLIFLESNVPHAIRNTSATRCLYFAFQFE